ncbi:hypothetical protein ABMA28_003618 [Loxostege sticticalis]|uniref:Uncharacterized protein n=1 Tax=Loxostege sticticalis TaxID=481309 RepID=A0ABD0SWM1_LOXSC
MCQSPSRQFLRSFGTHLDNKCFTDPTRTRCRFELREGEHHIVKKSRALGTRIGFGSGQDPNTYWNF